MSTTGLSRRHALTGVATAGLALPLLTACGGGGDAKDSSSAKPSAGPLGSTSEIPVGGGTIFADQKVVVTQPTEGEFKGFSAICTHQSCAVATVKGGTINCPCHGSAFSIEDGSVEGGPAPRPLPEVALSVEGDQISVA